MRTPEHDRTIPFIHIKPKVGWQLIDVKEVLQYLDLLFLLVSKEIKVKYKQTILGGLWAIIQPFLSMVVFTLFFGKLAKMPSDGVPYPIFNYTAMVAWTYFAGSITASANSMIGNTNLISKVYFPRILIPFSSIFAGLLDFVIAFVVLIGMMFYFDIVPTKMIIFTPILVFIMILIIGGVGMFLAALNVKYRDIRYTIPFLTQIWMFATPIVYPASLVPAEYQLIYSFNPMVGVIEAFRSALLGSVAFPTSTLLVSASIGIMLFFVGLLYFKRMEHHFADII